MRKRTSISKLLLSLAAYLAFMLVLLAALGSVVGPVELLVWLIVLGAGVALILRRHRRAHSSPTHPDVA